MTEATPPTGRPDYVELIDGVPAWALVVALALGIALAVGASIVLSRLEDHEHE